MGGVLVLLGIGVLVLVAFVLMGWASLRFWETGYKLSTDVPAVVKPFAWLRGVIGVKYTEKDPRP